MCGTAMFCMWYMCVPSHAELEYFTEQRVADLCIRACHKHKKINYVQVVDNVLGTDVSIHVDIANSQACRRRACALTPTKRDVECEASRFTEI